MKFLWVLRFSMAVWLRRKRVFALRRRMEAKGGEVRRVHIVYFLSRMGRIEHPHLIRIHHMNRTGVRLRDVKRWLADLRGKDMPNSFAWSYKRKYKTGYVWQDLLDDDLITPIADNEYVLKGSEVSSFPFDSCACAEKASAAPILKSKENAEKVPETKADDVLSPIDGETDGPPRRTVDEGEEEEEMEKSRGLEKSRGQTFGRSKSHTSGSSHVFFRNLLTCGAVETDDSAMVATNRRRKEVDGREICKVDVSGGPRSGSHPQQSNGRKTSNGTKNSKKTSQSGNQKTVVSSLFKPVAEPYCSQCGKGFKPEKLHAHMKSCKGLKSRMKAAGFDKHSQAAAKEEGLAPAHEATPGWLLAH